MVYPEYGRTIPKIAGSSYVPIQALDFTEASVMEPLGPLRDPGVLQAAKVVAFKPSEIRSLGCRLLQVRAGMPSCQACSRLHQPLAELLGCQTERKCMYCADQHTTSLLLG